MTDVHTASELEDEQEVDLSSAWRRLKLRWWLPIGGLLVGAVIGLALALSGGSVWRAQTIVYLGQPFAPLGGGQIQSLATNPRTVGEIIRSESALKEVSDKTGIPVSRLRSSISTRELLAAGQLRGINPLIEIAVKGSGKRKVELAAAELAERVVERVSVYVTEKVELLERQVAVSEAQLAAVESRIQAAQRQQDALITDTSIPLDQRLLLSANLNSVITTADARRTSLQDDLFEAGQLLNLAESVESSRVVEPSAASKTTARSSRTSLLVGALIGLLVGAIAALVAEPIAARRRAAKASCLMLDGKRVAVVVPAFDEERLVGETLAGIPDFVDRDLSSSTTPRATGRRRACRRSVIRGSRSSDTTRTPVWARPIATGYRRALEEEIDVTCVMTADNQMDPAELQRARRAGRERRGRVREGEPARLGRGVDGDPADALPRQRRAFAPDQDRLRATGTSPTRRRATRPSRWTRCAASTSTACTRATASRTTCSCT